jgi:hypothetical protein
MVIGRKYVDSSSTKGSSYARQQPIQNTPSRGRCMSTTTPDPIGPNAYHRVESKPPEIKPKMKPKGCPAPRAANAMFFVRPGGKVAPRRPAPAGERTAGARPNMAMHSVN